MAALTSANYSILSTLASQLGLKPVWSPSSGDAPSDVNGWLGYVLSDSNRSAQAAVVREQARLAIGTNVTPDAKLMFEYYRSLLDGTAPLPATINPTMWIDGRLPTYSDSTGATLS